MSDRLAGSIMDTIVTLHSHNIPRVAYASAQYYPIQHYAAQYLREQPTMRISLRVAGLLLLAAVMRCVPIESSTSSGRWPTPVFDSDRSGYHNKRIK